MTRLDRLLDSYRAAALTERDKGAAFERLVATWLVTDPVQARRFAGVEPFSEWARRQDESRADTGVNLVDRMLHHSHVITIRGESYRLREKRRSGLFRGITDLLSAHAPNKPESHEANS